MKKSAGLFVVALLVLAGGLAVASHVETPPISDGGELAYVRNYDSGALDTAAAGDPVTATYVSWSFDHDLEYVEDWTSRGRLADNVVFTEVRLPTDAHPHAPDEFRAVGQFERGMVTSESHCGCLGLMNSVNAGFVFVAKQPSLMEFQTTSEYEVANASDDRVELKRDGHVYAMETTNGTLSVDGLEIAVMLEEGGEIRSWIDGGAFPATTEVMHAEFDHLASDCTEGESVKEPTPRPAEPEEEPERENETEEETEAEEEEEGNATQPLSQGYWKNHPEAWPVENLTLGAESYNQSEALDLLATETEGDASVILAMQLIAAKLNVENGADSSEINETIEAADAELSAFEGRLPFGVDPSSEDGERLLELKDTLDEWNNSGDDEED